jgi:hypothetical protein
LAFKPLNSLEKLAEPSAVMQVAFLLHLCNDDIMAADIKQLYQTKFPK